MGKQLTPFEFEAGTVAPLMGKLSWADLGRWWRLGEVNREEQRSQTGSNTVEGLMVGGGF